MDCPKSSNVSSAQAVLLGALASGVNGPTWFVLKLIFSILVACLTAMLVLSFISSDMIMIFHVLLLVILSGILFLLLGWFVDQTGMVSIEQQMEEMGISGKDGIEQNKER